MTALNFLRAPSPRRRFLALCSRSASSTAAAAAWSQQLSFASPESDFQTSGGGGALWRGSASRGLRGSSDSSPRWSRELRFASPESDFTGCQARTAATMTVDGREGREEGWSHQLSFASPESDFTAASVADPRPEGAPLASAMSSWSGMLSFASPESDFCASSSAPPQTSGIRLPQTFAEALQREDAAVLVTTATKPHVVVHVNRAWEELCGYAPSEAWHRNPADLLQGPRSNPELARHTVASVLFTRSTADMYQVNRDKSGREFVNHVTLGPLLRWNEEDGAAAAAESDAPPLLVAILERVAPDQVPLRLIRTAS